MSRIITNPLIMLFTDFDNTDLTTWGPEDDAPIEGDWDDEDDEDFDDKIEDLDDLHEIQLDEDLGEPDPEDDDHFPEEDED